MEEVAIGHEERWPGSFCFEWSAALPPLPPSRKELGNVNRTHTFTPQAGPCPDYLEAQLDHLAAVMRGRRFERS